MTEPGDMRVTWTPVIGRVWRPLPDSAIDHGPGATFVADGTGGGLVSWTEVQQVERPGFRARLAEVPITIRKVAHSGC